MNEDIYVYMTNLPEGMTELIAPCEGGYTVWINKDLSRDKAVQAYRHALGHVVNDDWSESDVQTIERKAHDRRSKDCLSVSSLQFRFAD